MITKTTKINSSPSYPIEKPYTWNDIAFFDIETTGLSAKTSYLYLIGCMFYKDGTWQITQWLADDMVSEVHVLKEFIGFLKSFKRLIHFNGTGFDIPYILKKCNTYELDAPFEAIESYDIYKKLLPYKKFLPLTNFKLKTLEAFYGLKRLDPYTGQELIQIYANYLGRKQYEKLQQKTSPLIKGYNNTNSAIDNKKTVKGTHAPSEGLSASELEDTLLLHNLEDIKGLLTISEILYMKDIFEKAVDDILLPAKEPTMEYTNGNICNIRLPLSFSVPKPIRLSSSFMNSLDSENENMECRCIKINIEENLLTLFVPVFTGDLKFFFENYRDYYYLPKEDTAIHKSVAEYVDKEYKVKAKPVNCYTKKTGEFLPQTDNIYNPNFKFQYTDKITFFEIKADFLRSTEFKDYIHSLLSYLMKNKETVIWKERD